MINELLSALPQLIAFTAIPFVVYVIKTRSVKNFRNYIGLKKSTRKANLLALLMVIWGLPLLWLAIANEELFTVMTNPASLTGRIRQMGSGIESTLVILITAIVKTALAEEILFRGFIAKRLIAFTNFQAGNIIQATIFGVMHSVLFLSLTDSLFLQFVIFFFPATGAYFSTYINERLANGSIIPGWITHATSNLISYTVFAFLV